MTTPSAPSANTPDDETGDGPVTLEDRVAPGGEGSPGSNQSKTEPMAPSGSHPEPLVPPELGDMNVGAGDPQAPSHPALVATTGLADAAAGTPPTGMGGAGSVPAAVRPQADTTASTGRAPGPEQPVQDSTGTAHRAPGLMGTTPDGEAVETDVDAGAARMAGSIDEVVTGVRLPEAGEV